MDVFRVLSCFFFINQTILTLLICDHIEGNLIDKVMVTNTYYDYVAPDMVNLFVHNL